VIAKNTFEIGGVAMSVEICKISGKHLPPNYIFNRKLNNDRVKKLVKSQKDSKTPYFPGVIQILEDRRGNRIIINGQHRFQAYLNIFAERESVNPSLVVEIFKSYIENLNEPSEEEQEFMNQIFTMCNDSLPYTEYKPDVIAKKVVRQLEKIFPKAITDESKSSGTNRPKIGTRALFDSIRNRIPEEGCSSVEEIVNNIRKLNNKLGTNVDIWRMLSNSNSEIQLQKARKLGFYLNLQGDYELEKWIRMVL